LGILGRIRPARVAASGDFSSSPVTNTQIVAQFRAQNYPFTLQIRSLLQLANSMPCSVIGDQPFLT
jgi:hypothetical protein